MIWSINHPVRSGMHTLRTAFLTLNQDHGIAQESWNHRVTPEEVLKFTATIKGWPEVADRVIKSTPSNLIVDWKLMWRDPQPNWVSRTGRVVQLGDAAHTFLPSSGNGGTQAIEDGVSLATCLRIGGKHNIPAAMRVHNLLRFDRVSCLQALGVANREARLSSKSATPKAAAVSRLGSWFFDHDPERYAVESYENALAHVMDNKPFQNTNVPSGVDCAHWTMDGLANALDHGDPTIFDADWS